MSSLLNDLPAVPEAGWPWTATPPSPSADHEYPKISVVTPSYNQAEFLEATIRSVLLQNYPNLEYVVMDGGSTDGSVDIIEKYEPWIDHWVSESDRGQSHAINKGFKHCSGDLATFINSDDMLAPGALVEHVEAIGYEADTIYIGDCQVVDERGETIKHHTSQVRSFEDLVDIPNVWRAQPMQGHIVQMETLFPLDLYKEVGGLNEEMEYAMDYELWGELLLAGAEIEYTGIEVGIFREHEAQKTSDRWGHTKSIARSAIQFIRRHSTWSDEKKQTLIDRVNAYWDEQWRKTGRLARTGLPEPIVQAVREWRNEWIGDPTG